MSGARAGTKAFKLSSPNTGGASSSDSRGPEHPICRIQGSTTGNTSCSAVRFTKAERKKEIRLVKEKMEVFTLQESDDDDPQRWGAKGSL